MRPLSPGMAVFDFITDYHFETVDVAVFLTLLLLEGVLSFDNAAILAAMVRKLPVEQRRKALLYGLAGAYVFRLTAILLVAFIIENQWLKIVGGAYLLYLCVKHLVDRHPHEHMGDEVPGIAKKRLFGLSAFWSVVVAVELADIAFALDQVLVAVALTEKVLLIVVASFVAILFLRLSAYYVGRLMDWFPQLETLAYVAVGWVGLKLILTTGGHYLGVHWFEVLENKWISVAVTMSVIVLPVIVKAALDYSRKGRQPA
jgi:YkoY family integral membrane protein